MLKHEVAGQAIAHALSDISVQLHSLALNSNGSRISDYADFATIGAAAVAVVAAIIAVWTYKGTTCDAAKGHMHSIFKDYLALRLQHPDSNRPPDVARDFVSYKFYAMEEAYLWALEARARFFRRQSEQDHESWMDTIRFHIVDDREATDSYLSEPRIEKVFDGRFYAFVLETLANAQIDEELSPEPAPASG